MTATARKIHQEADAHHPTPSRSFQDQLQFNRPPNSSVSSSNQGTSPTASAAASSSSSSSSSDELHPNARKPQKPDFEGESNPNTGEVGGPKKDPLQWEREWTYGGRATDF